MKVYILNMWVISILCIFVCLTSVLNASGHIIFNQTSLKNEATSSIDTTFTMKSLSSYEQEITHIRYCTYKMNDELKTSYALLIGGFAIASVPTIGERCGMWNVGDVDHKKFFVIVGGISSLSGLILFIDSNKWLKYIAIGPKGMGFIYTF